MALKLRRRPQFWKSRKTLGDATSDYLKSTMPAYQLSLYAQVCADPTAWSSTDMCQSLYPEGAPSGGSSNCPAPDTSSFQAKIDDLKQNWNPTGVYTCSDLNSIVGRVMDMVNTQHNAVMAYQASYDTNYLDSVGDQFIEIGKQAISYQSSCNAHWEGGVEIPAKPSTTTIAAPGLKDWVVAAMTAMSEGMKALSLAACSRPFFLDALATFDSTMSSLWSVAKSIAGSALTLAQASIHAVEYGVGFAAWLVKWLPTGIIALIAVAGAGTGFYYWNKRTQRFPAFLP